MFNHHPAAKALAGLHAFDRATPALAARLDSTDPKEARLEAALDSAGESTVAQIRQAAASMVQAWCLTEAADLGEGESMADRLLALMVGIADENKDGDITDDEADVIDIALNGAFDFMVGCGVSEDDAAALLNDNNEEAAGRVAELLKGTMGEDEAGSMADVDAFAFDGESQESVMDGVLDAVYRKRMVIRAGKKVRINKRVSGKVVLSAAQKVAIRKAGRKAHSATARMRRVKSMRIRTRTGLAK